MTVRCQLARPSHLPQILELQERNLRTRISPDEARREGFVTVRHDIDLLTAMNEAAAHAVAIDEEVVVAYALVMLRAFRTRIPVLGPMFDQLADYAPPGDARDFFVMGQICVDRPYRGSGVFGQLYRTLRAHYSPSYREVVTEISASNVRSLRAHEKVGFRIIHEYEHGPEERWIIVAWDWS